MAKKGIIDLKERFDITQNIRYSPHPLFDIYGEQVEKIKACQKLGLDPSVNYILSFGLIRKYKGLDMLLKAFANFSDKQPNHKLIIAGECYDDWNEYQTLIDQLELKDKIKRFDLFIPDNQVKYFFSAADFLALTYRTATQSGVTQIAYTMDLPILVTNVGDLAEMVPNDKVGKVTSTEIKEITQGLLEMSNPLNLDHYVQGIQEEKKRFEWSALCENLDLLAKQKQQ